MFTSSRNQPTRIQSFVLALIQVIELAIVGAVGVPAILVERMEPGVLVIGLSLLLLPLILRLFFCGRPTTLTLALWPLFVLALLTAVTVRVTPSWEHTWPELVRLLWGMAVCITVVNWINPWPANVTPGRGVWRQLSPRLIWATITFFGLGGILTAVGLLSMGSTNKIARLDAILQLLPKVEFMAGSGFNPNRVAGVAVLFAPLALALTLGPLLPRRRSWSIWLGWLATKPLVALLASFFCGAILLTQSRGAWLAMGCALLLILSLLGRRGLILLAALAVIATSVVVTIGPARLLDRLTVYDLNAIDPAALIQDRNVAGRLILWQRALHGLADAPLTGMGLGAFEAVSQQPYPQVAGFKPDPDMSHVHNIVLQMGVDLGAPGIIVFVALLIMMAQMVVSLVRRATKSSALHTWSVGLLGSFVAYFVYSMVDAITLGARPSVAVWFFFGLCLGVGEWAQETANQADALEAMRTQRQPRATPQMSPPLAPPIRQPVTQPITQSITQPITQPVIQPMTQGMTQEAWEARAWAATAGTHEE